MKLGQVARVALASSIWFGVAVMLMWRGLVPHFGNIESTGGKVATLALAILIGGAKGRFVLRKSAARTAAYIARRPDPDWFFLCFHPILYAVIPVMIAFGYTLRYYLADSQPGIVAGVYIGVAAAMLTGILGFRAQIDSEG